MIFPSARLLGIGLLVKTVARTIIFSLQTGYKLLRVLHMRLFALFLVGVYVYDKLNPLQKGSSTAQILLIVGAMIFLISLFYFAKSLSEKERGDKKKKEKPAPAAQAPTTVTLQSADGQTIPIVVAPPQQGGVSIPAYQPMAETQFEGRGETSFHAKQEAPKYFRVAQNPKYVMTEYSDRVELFYESPRGLKYVRTDYKNSQTDF